MKRSCRRGRPRTGPTRRWRSGVLGAAWLASSVVVAAGCGGEEAIVTLCDEADVRASLWDMEELDNVEKVACGDYVEGAAECYRMTIRQPILHDNLDRGVALADFPDHEVFDQRVTLIHRSCEAPVILEDPGYAIGDVFYGGELGDLFGANWIRLEHRYQGGSAPGSRRSRWDGLTIENGAADLHRAIEIFKYFYPGPRVTTGVSKGGITAIYHRHLYPKDVRGTVPYVAPASLDRRDARYQDYLDRVGDTECHRALREFQVRSLTSRRGYLSDRLAARLGTTAELSEPWLESAVASIDWSFWQVGDTSACGSVPDPLLASEEDDWAFFDGLVLGNGFAGLGPANASVDPDSDRLALAYEWLTEQGFALQVGNHVEGQLRHPRPTMAESFIEAGVAELPPLDTSITESAIEWVEKDARRMVLVYGEFDPWSGGQLPAPQRESSARFTVPRTGHGATVAALPLGERDRALLLIGDMMEREPDLGVLEAAMRSEGVRRAALMARVRELGLAASSLELEWR